jgi:hypothetical protein
MRHGESEVQSENLVQDLTDLGTRGDDELKERWRQSYGTKPPGKIHHSLMVAAIAHRMQVNSTWRAKGFGPSISNAHLQRRSGWPTSTRLHGLQSKPGTVLVRDWGGVSYQVKVLEDRLLFRGKRYKSLSEVARVITGARWSGPLFFGLRPAAKEQNHGSR